jgi:hypothetical protein
LRNLWYIYMETYSNNLSWNRWDICKFKWIDHDISEVMISG